MEPTSETLQALSGYLTSSLSPSPPVRKAAEHELSQGEGQPGFLLLVLHLVREQNVSMDIRQAAGVYFKNVIKRRWPEDSEIAQGDREQIKNQLVPLMISLSTPALSRLQSQIGEAVAEIASMDFPERWQGLTDELVSSLTADNFTINNGVLATAHSIFKRWRSQFRTDDLYSEINFVLSRFCEPYFGLFQHVDTLLSAPSLPAGVTTVQLAQSLQLLLQLFHDLNSQDLPPFFEEHMNEFMGDPAAPQETDQGRGWLRKYLVWERPELMGDDEEDTPGPLQKIRASICEIAELYAQRYLEVFPQLGLFVDGVWRMLSSVGLGTREDVLVSRALRFLSVVVKMGSHRDLFAAQETLQGFCERIVLPNMAIRQHEEEMFEDDPHEYIRTDLEPSAESDTRRQAATDFTRALLEQFEGPVTEIVQGYITNFLQQYTANPAENWKAKDTAIYLLVSIASRGSTMQAGVTSVNALVDVVDFFGQNVYADLAAAPGSVHPILLVDAIKFLYTFRSQLTKDQLLSVLPLLVTHLGSDNYVVYSYAAITIERILFIKVNGQALFNQADIRPYAENILMALFAKIEAGGTPEKIAENDYLMKCAMRVIITARQALTPVYSGVLGRIVNILGEISKNPSNPKFNQYCFESVAGLIRFVCESTPAALPQFEAALFGPAQVILGQDVTEFIPYIFQILSQLLELHPVNELPQEYQALLGPLLFAALWEQRGNVPALVRLWKALLMRGASTIVANGQLQGLLGVFQKLIQSKISDIYGFELVQALFEFIPRETMQAHTKTVFMLILTKLQTKPSAQFTQGFVVFFCFLCAVESVGPDFVISSLDSIQPGLTGQILKSFIFPESQKISVRDRKLVAVGLTKLLTRSESILNAQNVAAWPPTFEAVLKLFLLNQDLSNKGPDDLGELDLEDSSFQSSFSKLGASEAAIRRDPVADVADEKLFLSKDIARRSAEKPGVLGPLMQQVSPEATQTFVQYMQSNGDQVR